MRLPADDSVPRFAPSSPLRAPVPRLAGPAMGNSSSAPSFADSSSFWFTSAWISSLTGASAPVATVSFSHELVTLPSAATAN